MSILSLRSVLFVASFSVVLAVPDVALAKNDFGGVFTEPLIVRACSGGTGRLCTSDEDCPGAETCSIVDCVFSSAVFVGSRNQCMYSFTAREAFCKTEPAVPGGDPGWKAVSESVCGARERDDTTGNGLPDDCTDLENYYTGDAACHYCQSLDGETPVDGSCIKSSCAPVETPCPPGEACDDRKCPGGGACAGGGQACFHPVIDRPMWTYPTEQEILSNPRLATCTADAGLLDHGYDTDLASRLNPSPYLQQCIVFGSNDSRVYAIDAASQTSEGACLWRRWVGNGAESSPAVDPSTGHLYVGTNKGLLHGIEPSPKLDPREPCSDSNPLWCERTVDWLTRYGWCEDANGPIDPVELCDPDGVDTCSSGACVGSWEPWGPRQVKGRMRFDPLVLRDAGNSNSPVPGRLLVATDKYGFKLIDSSPAPICKFDSMGQCERLLTKSEKKKWVKDEWPDYPSTCRWDKLYEVPINFCESDNDCLWAESTCQVEEKTPGSFVLDAFPKAKFSKGQLLADRDLTRAMKKLRFPMKVKAIQALPPTTDPWPGFTMQNPGRIYANVGASENPTGVLAVDIDLQNDRIEPAWLVGSGNTKGSKWVKFTKEPSETSGEAVFSIDGLGNVRVTDADGIQVHKSSPVLSTDGATIYVDNRSAGKGQFKNRTFGIDTTNPDQEAPVHTFDENDAPFWWSNVPDPQPIAAAPALARTKCERWTGNDDNGDGEITEDELHEPPIQLHPDCCGPDGLVDTLFFGDKNAQFYGIVVCQTAGGMPLAWDEKLKFPPVTVNGGKTRSTPVVATDIGTVYVGNDNADDVKSSFYAFDMETGRIKWSHNVSADTNVCAPSGTNFGKGCYASPLPHVTATSPTLDAVGCTTATAVTLSVDAWTVNPNNPNGSGQDMDSPLPPGSPTSIVGDLEWQNETEGTDYTACTGGDCVVSLVAGPNTIVLQATDELGKVGRTEVTVCHDTTCPGICPGI